MAAIVTQQSEQSPIQGQIQETFLIDTNDVTTVAITLSQIKRVSNWILNATNATAAARATAVLVSVVETASTAPVVTVNPGATGCLYRFTVIGVA